ncbi:helix-turn-helix domain-containing protein [Oleidesulfovibrio sp.]|uniref:helix-turn-helix domain-containing protein n=1 Tax=Oleidesulfovibrio sp. TaxID=2909707 RepID=UPI003A846738
MRLQLDLSTPTRQAMLEAWLVSHGVSKAQLAAHLGIHTSYVGKIIAGQRRPKVHIESLIKLGVPAELLPTPCDGQPGPKPKKEHVA